MPEPLQSVPKLLLIGHSLCPERGSEPGLSWNWAWYMSRYYDVWIIAHPEFKPAVEAYRQIHPNSRLHIEWLDGSDWDFRKGQRGIHKHYRKWLREAALLAARLHKDESFEIVHHVSLGTVSAPPTFWSLGIPFIWGPLGGGQLAPFSLLGIFGRKVWLEAARWLVVRTAPLYPDLRAAVAKSAMVLTTNRDTAKVVARAGGRSILPFLDNGIADEAFPTRPPSRQQPVTIRVLWAGRFEKRKGLPLALEAFALLRANVSLQLRIAGSGEEDGDWREMARNLKLGGQVKFLGLLNRQQMREEFETADIFLFTSVRESFGSVTLEALSHGIPVVTLDLHGTGDNLPSAASIKVPVGSRLETAQRLANALAHLAEDSALRTEKGRAAWEYAWEQRWSERAANMKQIYDGLLPARKAALHRAGQDH